jgi:hypothetical protein
MPIVSRIARAALVAPVIALVGSSMAFAQAVIQHTDPNSAPAPYAQKLLNDELAKHPDIVIMAMHVTPPGKKDNVIVASNIGRFGKKSDEDDERVITTGKSNLEVNKTGNHFEVETVILDKNDKNIGAIGIVYNYKPGDDKAALEKKAMEVRDEMKSQINSKEQLFEKVQ